MWEWVRRYGSSRRTLGAFLLIGFGLREAFSFWTGHPYDIEVWIRTGKAVSEGFNPYTSFWPPDPGTSFAFLNEPLTSAAYLPFWPAYSGASYELYRAAGSHPLFLVFLLKQPEIAADLVAAVLMFRLVVRWTGDRGTGAVVLAFWCLFPYDIVISAVWGQFDALVLVCVLASLWYQDATRRNIAYGIGIFVKWLPAVLLPLEVFRNRGWRRFAPVIALGVALGLTVGSFLLLGWSFLGIGATATSQSHGGGGGMNVERILTDPGAVPAVLLDGGLPLEVLQYLWVPLVILAGWIAARRNDLTKPVLELQAVMLVIVAFLASRSGLYEQYMLNLFPLMLMDVVVFHPDRKSIFYFLIGLCSVYLILNNVLGLWFVSPVDMPAFQLALQLNASSGFGTFRYYVLDALAIIITITLVQWAYLLTHPQAKPRPWLLPPWPAKPTAPATSESPPSPG